MVCQLESEEGGAIVLMVADDEGACRCPGREDKDARQQAKLCGEGLTCAAADKPWGYCCEGNGVCRQAEGCTSSKNQCLADCPGVKRPGIGVEADLSAGVKADCARRMCNKNGAAAKMVADSNGDCRCPAFIADITGDAAAKEGEECTGSLQSSSGRMESLKSASMTSTRTDQFCSGMVCQLESEEGGAIVLMVADDEGACRCPGREDKDARQQAKLCGKGLTCAAADKPWGYCCEGNGVCRQAEGCTSSKNQCLADCPGVKRPGIAIEFSRTCQLGSGTPLEDGDCKTDEDCEAHSKCIIAPSTGHEVVGGIGKCFNRPGEATDGPGMCSDLCDLMACPGDCKMGICGTWKVEKTMPKAASKRCNRGAGEIGVMKGSDFFCEKSAAEAIMLTYEGISMEDLKAGQELLFRIQVRDNLIKSNEGKLKLSDIVEVLLKERQSGRRRAGNGIV